MSVANRQYPDFVTFLTEGNALYVLWRLHRGDRVGLLGIWPILPFSEGFLRRWFERERSKGRMIDLYRDRKDLICMDNFFYFIRAYRPYPTMEPWLKRYFAFDDAERKFGRYARVFKHIVNSDVAGFKNNALFVAHSLRLFTGPDAETAIPVRGAPSEVTSMYEDQFGTSPPGMTSRTLARLRRLGNAAVGFLVLVYGAGWIVAHTRLRNEPQVESHVGLDFTDDPNLERERVLADELMDAPTPLHIVFRNKAHQRDYAEKMAPHKSVCVGDVNFGFVQGAGYLGLHLRDTLRLILNANDQPPRVHWQLVKAPLKRVMFKALFYKYRFKYFFSKDDYNYEHIVRTDELRSIGCKSMSRTHGVAAFPVRFFHYIYIDFDIYYVFGNYIKKHFKDTWLRGMQVKAAGCYGMTRQQLHDLALPRPPDIAVFHSPTFQELAVADLAVALAREFPERTIYFKIRKGLGVNWDEELPKLLARAPKNLKAVQLPLEELMCKVSYVFGDPSTTVLEGMQFGSYSFCAVLDSRWSGLMFDEEFPECCIYSIEQAIERVKSLENGTWEYPYEAFDDLVNLHGQCIWDIIRTDMGLPPKEGRLDHLAFLDDAGKLRRSGERCVSQ